MKTMIGTVLVVASLATAANAADPDPSDCRKMAAIHQEIADRIDAFRVSMTSEALVIKPSATVSISDESVVRADDARRNLAASLGSYRDALDAIAAEYRACKPRE